MNGAYDGLRLATHANADPKKTAAPPIGAANTQSNKKDDQMNEDEMAKALAEAEGKGFKAANARMNAVFASEHYEGREKLAATLLGTASMSAEEITTALAASPKVEKASATDTAERAEEAARKEVQKALNETGNSNVDANEGGGEKKSDFNVMAAAVGRVNDNKLFG